MMHEQIDLLHGYLNGTLGDADFARLQALLRESREARAMLRNLSTVDAKLQEMAAVNPDTMRLLTMPEVRPVRSKWLSWHPLTAAAAGLVIGLFSASMVWGYVGPYAIRALTLLQESFESGPSPQVTGMPIEAGRWSGDYSEIVGEYRGVKPARGEKMLRFVRANYEGKPSGDGYVGDLFRIIDLRGAGLDVGRGDACVSVEAKFRALPQEGLGRGHCGVTVYALDALPVPGERHDLFLKARAGFSAMGEGAQSTGTTILATSSRQEVMDPTGNSWQSARIELRVPPGANYFMVHLHESLELPRSKPAPQLVEFGGMFVDDIRVSLTHRPPLP